MKIKQRADIIIVEKGLCESREQARRLILAGKVRSGKDRIVLKPSEEFPETVEFQIEEICPYVSRGAYKLLPALEKHLPNMTGLIVLDVGASTGGFTDLMLQRGAEKVYAVDAGSGQLHSKLRRDLRVISFEKVNARHLKESFLPEKADVLTMDVSFISAVKILPSAGALLKNGGWAFILVKPQFEAGRKDVGKGGVVRDEKIRLFCIEKVANFAETNLKWRRMDVIASPLTGPKGNQEYIAVFRKF